MRSAQAPRVSIWARFLAWARNTPPLKYPNLGLICLGLFVDLVGVGAIVPVRAIYARDAGATMAELGMMASGFLLGQFLFQLPGGWLSDRIGRKPLLVAGVAVVGVMSFLFLLDDSPWYFITLRFLEGAAGGAIIPAANAYVIDSVPAKERGAAFGWVGSANSAGFMLGPAIGGVMGDWFGYTSPFIFGGVASLLTAALLWAKMTNPKPGAEPLPDEPDGAAVVEEGKIERRVPRRLFAPALAGAIALAIASGFGDGLFISIWTLWLDDLNASTAYIGLTFITFSLPLMVMMPFTGKMADKYRLAPLIIVPGLLISTVYFTYGFTTDLFLIAALGIFEGAMIALMDPAIRAFTANLSPDNARGKIQGIVSGARTITGFTSSMLVAVLYGINLPSSMGYPFYMLTATQIVLVFIGGIAVWRVESATAKQKALTISRAHLPVAERQRETEEAIA
jgi:MFS transporter, DHA1 family, multidrug resistance protein